jgi:energy-coupling factor transporter ATP-binding protein EcfA2
MKLLDKHFELFDREHFHFSKIKENQPDKVENIKSTFQECWNHWKAIMDESFKLIENSKFVEPDSENWTNGWGVRNRFWTRFKHKDRVESSSCIATMINKDNLRVYLEWHDYNSEKSSNSVKQHNKWIEHLNDWVNIPNVNTEEYRVWTSNEDGNKEYITLNQYLNDIEKQKEYKRILDESDDTWIRIGKVTPKEQVIHWDRVEDKIAKTITELEWLYEKTEKENRPRRYWLFCVFYSQNPMVWEKCKEFNVAAMQYEEGKQHQPSVTRHLKLIRQISVGDYVVAYTGNKGFLALGEVTKEFYNEEDESKYFTVNGEHWKQRIGVNWFKTVDVPVIYDRGNFKEKLGLKPNTVMSSTTIFEIPKKGYLFVERLMRQEVMNEQDSTTENTFTDFVLAKGFNFDKKILKNYILSLKSKPFTILSGISGTGKTKIAQFFAEYMCPDEEVVIDEFNQNDDEFSFKYQIKPYNLKYKQLIIPRKFALLLSLPNEGTSTTVRVIFDGIEGECRLYNAENGSYRQLTLKGDIGRNLVDNYKEGDYLRISFEKEEDKDVIIFHRINPEKKVIKKKSDRYCFISVRPDWIDNKSLIGYYNPITEHYQVTELLKLMLRAKNNKDKPYFVIFDEMNLAKVEYYFSDFLSCLESRRIGEDGKLRSERIKLHDMAPIKYTDSNGEEYIIPPNLEIPENIYFTGTVNIDETTYMFSPKVLDRANVIEFNDVDLEDYLDILKGSSFNGDQKINATEDFIKWFTNDSSYHLKLINKQFKLDDELIGSYEHIKNINQILKGYNLHFGYRVVDEILFYLCNNKEVNYFDIDTALDLQILQRILPKLHGNRKKLEQPLTELLYYCFGFELDAIAAGIKLDNMDYNYLECYFGDLELEDGETSSSFHNKKPIFPLTARKVFRMLENLRNNGFASFIE